MFSNLASYLGYQATSPDLEAEDFSQPDVKLCAVEEDEWVLVEPHDISETATTRPNALPGARPSSMQESWYITPPPSFTSKGPIHMETSPFENLLIEHPSMSVYQKAGRRKLSNSSPSGSEEESPLCSNVEDGAAFRGTRKERVLKSPRNKGTPKYSKKCPTKRPPVTSSEDGVSLPSTSEDDERKENKEVALKNFVKSPRRSISLSKKYSNRGSDTSSNDEMISILTSNDEGLKTLVIHSLVPPRRLYSDVLRTTAKIATIEDLLPPMQTAPTTSAAVSEERSVTAKGDEDDAENSMAVDDSLVEKDRRRTGQTVLSQHRQHFLNRSAQKLEQRKTCELAKRNMMGRNNKAREFNSRNKRQRRSDMMQRHSGVNNNRKC